MEKSRINGAIAGSINRSIDRSIDRRIDGSGWSDCPNYRQIYVRRRIVELLIHGKRVEPNEKNLRRMVFSTVAPVAACSHRQKRREIGRKKPPDETISARGSLQDAAAAAAAASDPIRSAPQRRPHGTKTTPRDDETSSKENMIIISFHDADDVFARSLGPLPPGH